MDRPGAHNELVRHLSGRFELRVARIRATRRFEACSAAEAKLRCERKNNYDYITINSCAFCTTR